MYATVATVTHIKVCIMIHQEHNAFEMQPIWICTFSLKFDQKYAPNCTNGLSKMQNLPTSEAGGGALTYISMRTCSRKKAGKGVFCRQSHGPRGPRFGEKGPIVQQWAFTYPRLGCQFHKHDKGLAIQHFCRVL